MVSTPPHSLNPSFPRMHLKLALDLSRMLSMYIHQPG